MKIKKTNPKKQDFLPLDDYEAKLMNDIENDNFKPSKEATELKAFFKQAAKSYANLQKSKPVTVRMKNADLIKLKAKAKEQNIPYQTLLNSIVSKYVGNKS